MSNVGRTQGASGRYEVVFTDKKDNATMDHMDFLKLMVSQMQNQDFTNPMDNTEMMTQMVQFSNMQMMQDMASYSKSNYAVSLVGKTVTASRFTVSGELETTTGEVEKLSLVDNEYVFYVGGKKYTLDQIMSVEGKKEGTGQVDPKYKLAIDNIGETSATLNWKVPTEDEKEAAELKYSVYYSTSKSFNTVADVEKGTLVGDKNQKDITKIELEKLEQGTEYFVNVVVTDKDGNKRVYSAIEFKTLGIASVDPEEEVGQEQDATENQEKPETSEELANQEGNLR